MYAVNWWIVSRMQVECQSVVCEGAECSIDDFELAYDALVYYLLCIKLCVVVYVMLAI